MPDLSELFKGAVGEIPPFDPAALVAKQRHRRQLQVVGAASALAAIAAVAVVMTNGSGDNVALKTRPSGSSDASSTTAAASSTTEYFGSTTAGTAPVQTTLPPNFATTTVPGSRAPQTNDFTGTLTVSSTTVHVGDAIDLELRLHNATADVINTARDAEPTAFALACEILVNAGPPGNTGQFDTYDAWYLASPTMQPNGDDVITVHWSPADYDVGRMGCQPVVVTHRVPNWRWPSWTAVPSIPAIVVTVLPGNGTSTTAASTVPITTVPPT